MENLNRIQITDDRNLLKDSKDLVFFSGAGISRAYPSNNPLSNEIVSAIVNLFCQIAFDNNKEKTNEFFRDINISKLRLEYLFEIMKNILGKNALEFFTEINCDSPNLDHLYIAKLCQINNINDIFTLNFDLLHEKSFKLLGCEYFKFDSNNLFSNFTEHYTEKNINIYHLHGSIEFLNEISVSLLDVGLSLQKERERILHEKLKHNDIFCFGYSDDDPDSFPILAESPNRIFWYVYDKENIPRSVQELKKQKGDKLIYIYRDTEGSNLGKKEEYFHDSLLNIFPHLCNFKKEVEAISSALSVNNNLDIEEKLNHFCEKIRKSINENNENPQNIAYLILGRIYFRQNQFKKSLEMLKSIKPAENSSDLSFYLNQQMAGNYEAINDPISACDFWEKNYEIFSREKRFSRFKDFSEVRWANVKLKVWKRNIKEIGHLIEGLDTLFSKTNHTDPDISTIAYLGIADICHHIAEYFPFVVIDAFFTKDDSVGEKLSIEKSEISRKLAFLFFNLFERTGIRKILLLISAHFYNFVAEDTESRNYQYKMLSQLRLIELFAAMNNKQGLLENNRLKTFSRTKYDSRIIRNYYQWIDIDTGVGNSYLTDGIVSFFNKDYDKAKENIIEAKKNYSEDKTGLIKCKIFLIRLLDEKSITEL